MTGPVPDSWVVDPELAGAREVHPGVWRLRLPMSWPGIDHANAYLVERADGVMLLDTGPGGDPTALAALERAVAATGHALTDVRALVITHAHSDHLGVARQVLEISGAKLWMHPDNGHFFSPVRHPERAAARRAQRARLDGVPAALRADFSTVAEEVEGGCGDLADYEDLLPPVALPSTLGDWEALPGPGHSPSQVLLVQREHGIAIVGDVLCRVFVGWMDYGHSRDPVGEWLTTLDRLAGIPGLRLALPGHGRALTDLPTVLDEHRAGLTAIVERTRSAVGETPATAWQLLEKIHGTPQAGYEAVGYMTELLSALRHLRIAGAVDRSETEGMHRYVTLL